MATPVWHVDYAYEGKVNIAYVYKSKVLWFIGDLNTNTCRQTQTLTVSEYYKRLEKSYDDWVHPTEYKGLISEQCGDYSALAGEDSIAPSSDLTGSKWSITETGVTENCGDGLGTDNYSITVSAYADGDITVSTPAGVHSGTYTGSNVSYSGSFSEDGGTTTTSVELTVNSGYDRMTGTSNWGWSDDSFTCNGTSNIVAVRTGGSSRSHKKTISGYVVNGAISNTKVCIDTNGDWQCNPNEPGSTTSSNGYYSLEYEESIDITEFVVITDNSL